MPFPYAQAVFSTSTSNHPFSATQLQGLSSSVSISTRSVGKTQFGPPQTPSICSRKVIASKQPCDISQVSASMRSTKVNRTTHVGQTVETTHGCKLTLSGKLEPGPTSQRIVHSTSDPVQTTASSSEVLRRRLEAILHQLEAKRARSLESVCSRLGIPPPANVPRRDSNGQWQLNAEKQRVATSMAQRHNMSLTNIIEVVRGQTCQDPRPNKAMYPSRFSQLLDGYEHKETLEKIAKAGIQPLWKETTPTQTKPIKNHRSASRHLNAVIKAIRTGQDAGQYLVLDVSVLRNWNDVQISPLGAVAKSGCDPDEDVRLIHDLSSPSGHSTNDISSKEKVPDIEYRHVAAIAQRIEHCRQKYPGMVIKLMKGDVKGAFRHLMLASGHARWMAATIMELGVLIVDMSAPFGWTSSPAYYGAFGGAISWLVARESPASMDPTSTDTDNFFAYEWVDDHVMIEPDIKDRLHIANDTLRTAMMAILGPRAINDEKFSAWATTLQVLGLEFDTTARTISMPQAKIHKALLRVHQLQRKSRTSRTDLQKLLGSLRHICSCLGAAKPFYQRLHAACVRAPRHGTIQVDETMQLDLQWFQMILTKGQLQKLPLLMFAALQPIDVHLYMDASNSGLAILNPATMQYIQLQFDQAERDLINDSTGPDGSNINVHEQLCIALAAWSFGSSWTSSRYASMLYVKAWSDNTSAVSWTNKAYSPNRMAQEITRAIGLAEAVYGFRISCGHLPGSINTMADAGSRAWTSPFNHPNTDKSSEDLHGLLVQLQSHALAPGSRSKYSSTWDKWSAWCELHGYSKWLPREAQEHSYQLALFAVHYWYSGTARSGQTLAANTVLSAISHVSWYHLRDRGYKVGLHAGHELAVRGMQRLSPPPKQKQPVTLAILHEIRRRCDFKKVHDRVLWGAAVVGFFFLLRRSEYLADGRRVKPYIIRVQDVQFTTPQGLSTSRIETAVAVTVNFRGSKTDQSGRGTKRTLHRSGSPWLCPVLAAWELSRSSQSADYNEVLCSLGPGNVLQANDLASAIKKAAETIGADPSKFGTHSMRSGGATAMFSAGVDRLTIKKLGGGHLTPMNDTPESIKWCRSHSHVT